MLHLSGKKHAHNALGPGEIPRFIILVFQCSVGKMLSLKYPLHKSIPNLCDLDHKMEGSSNCEQIFEGVYGHQLHVSDMMYGMCKMTVNRHLQ
jgi:hypothetical protein